MNTNSEHMEMFTRLKRVGKVTEISAVKENVFLPVVYYHRKCDRHEININGDFKKCNCAR